MVDPEKTEWSNLDWKSYQKIVAGLHALGEDVDVEHEYDYPVHSGGTKEMDVVVWDRRGRYTVTTLIECKFHDEPIEQEVVDSLVGVLDNSDANKGVVVSKNGFQSGAKERAKGSGIELWTLRQIIPDIDLEDRIRRVNIDVTVNQPKFEVLDMDVRAVEEEQKGREINATFTPQNSMIYTLDREPTGETLLDRLNQRFNSVEEGEHTEEFEDSLLLIQGEFYQLVSVDYRVTYSSGTTEYTTDLLDDADLTLKDELGDTHEFVSLSEALRTFVEEVDDQE
ncbi:Restriction endonuclease [Halorientalis persicus]|uniref:Restriction endonuclease n=1 Tax=Halorientalis persicus TaxID=1367881 RepID=A0A1H8RBL5_9EURY|nr:restriction endonuclease [Halorientalis persicus]SEO63781.1 Restriction endonuclease [Halorientalis persicus]